MSGLFLNSKQYSDNTEEKKKYVQHLFFKQKLVQLFHKGVDILKLAVYGRKSHIRDLIDILELFHGQLADCHRGDFAVEGALQMGFDRIHHFLNLFGRDGTLLARAHNTGGELGAVKDLAGFIALYDKDRNGLDNFMSRETLAAFQTLAAAANTLALVGGTGIDYFAFFISAVGTLHINTPIS